MDYDKQTLQDMANFSVRDLGVVKNWSIRVTSKGTSLVVTYTKLNAWTAPLMNTDCEMEIAL